MARVAAADAIAAIAAASVATEYVLKTTQTTPAVLVNNFSVAVAAFSVVVWSAWL